MKTSRNLGMPYMELRSTFTSCFFLFLILPFPYFSRGGSEVLDSEIYEIDYRGPETHTSIPPPDHSHAKPLSTHRKSSAGAAKVKKGLMGSTHKEEEVKKIRG